MRNWFILAAVGLCIWMALQSLENMGTSGHDSGHGAPAGFVSSYDTALARARAEGKPVMLVFSASWCPPCRMMREQVYQDSAVLPVRSKFVCAYLDVDDPGNRGAAGKYGVSGIPHYEFVASNGVSFGQFVGGCDPGSFASVLREMLAKAR